MKYSAADVQRAADMLYELSKLLPDVVPLSTTSGLCPQPAAPIDQLASVDYHHSASAQAAIAHIRGVIARLERGPVPSVGECDLAAQVLRSALVELGARP